MTLREEMTLILNMIKESEATDFQKGCAAGFIKSAFAQMGTEEFVMSLSTVRYHVSITLQDANAVSIDSLISLLERVAMRSGH